MHSVAEGTTIGKNLSDLAYKRLKGMIFERALPGGTQVIEERLAAMMALSRTPIREAILRLSAEGLLVKQGNRSFSVRIVTATEFFQSHKVRGLLEPEAVLQSAGRIPSEDIERLRTRIAVLMRSDLQEQAHWEVDEALHETFAVASGNAVLTRLVRSVRVSTRLFEVSQPLRRVQRDGEEHLAILEAFLAGEIKGASRAMARHIRNLSSDTANVLRGIAPA